MKCSRSRASISSRFRGRPRPSPVLTREPEQLDGAPRRRARAARRRRCMQYAYKAPAAADERAPALSLLLSILVDGDASRLYRLLVEEQKLAIDVGGHWHEGFDPALLWLYFTLPEGADPDAVQPVIDAELARIVSEGVTAAELRRAKNLVAVSFWKKLATIDGKAQLLGEYEVFHGDWEQAVRRAGAVRARDRRSRCSAVARDVLDVNRAHRGRAAARGR